MDLTLSLKNIEDAKEYLDSTGKILKSPLIKYNGKLKGKEIYLKLENLQPTGSFKIRGAFNAIHNIPKHVLKEGIYTASAGNFGQGFAWAAKELQVDCSIIAPDTIPKVKLKAMEAEKAKVELVQYEEWFDVLVNRKHPGYHGTFIHPGAEKYVMAGNSTIGTEILEQLPDVDTIICPFGSGGMACGIGAALEHYKADVKLLVTEVDCAAPVYWSLKAGQASFARNFRRTFVDGMGARQLLPVVYPLVSKYVTCSLPVSELDIVAAMKALAEKNHVVAEPAGAASVASALSDRAGGGKIVCVISGGNIDMDKYTQVLQGLVPEP